MISSWVVLVIISLRLGSCWMLHIICWTIAASCVLSLNVVSVGCKWLFCICHIEDSLPNGSKAADIVVGVIDVWVHLVAY